MATHATARALTAALQLALLLALAPLLGGCATGEAPRLNVTEASVTERTSDGMVIAFTLDATHDNPHALPLREINYTLSIGGREVFSGLRSPEATLPRFGRHTVTIPAAIPADLAPEPGEHDFELRGRITYLAPGRLAEVLFDAGLRRPTSSFRERGRIRIEYPDGEGEPDA